MTCIKCGKKGSLLIKQTKTRGRTYRYWYVEHWDGIKRSWCYIGRDKNLTEEYRKAVESEIYNKIDTTTSYLQTDTQSIHRSNNLKTSSKSKKMRGCRLAWSRLLASGARDPGSNPGSPTILKLNRYGFPKHFPFF